MKPIIPIIITLFSVSLTAQEAPTPTKPQPTVKEHKASSGTSASAATSRRVTLPPSSKAQPSAKVPQPTTRNSAIRTSSRRVVLPPNSGVTSRPPTTTNHRPIPRTIPTATTGSGNVRRVSTTHSRPAPPTLQENITIQLKGTTGTGEAIDLALTGIGPVFQSDIVIGENDTILTHTYSIVPQGANYLVEFSIGTRIKMVTGSNGSSKTYQFRDNSINGKVLLKPGEPVTVSYNQGKVLDLTISKP